MAPAVWQIRHRIYLIVDGKDDLRSRLSGQRAK
jgi:hypothetical protein